MSSMDSSINGIMHSSHPLAAFRDKYWGKNMEDEGRAHKGIQNISIGNLDMTNDGHVHMDDKETIANGCCALDIEIEGIPFRKIWVRREYIRIYDCLLQLQKHQYVTRKARYAVVLGQRGVGKSAWMYYALRRRLAEKEPVIFYYQQMGYFFSESGVSMLPLTIGATHMKKLTWTLVDSDELQDDRIPQHLVRMERPFFVVHCTSSPKERSEKLEKTTNRQTIVMNPWTRAEIFRASALFPPGTVSNAVINSTYDDFGPTPHLCLDLASDPYRLSEYEQEVDFVINTLSPAQLANLAMGSCILQTDEISDKLCLITRKDPDDVRSLPMTTWITLAIRRRVMHQVCALAAHHQTQLLHLFSRFPRTKSISSAFWQAKLWYNMSTAFWITPLVNLGEGEDLRWTTGHDSDSRATYCGSLVPVDDVDTHLGRVANNGVTTASFRFFLCKGQFYIFICTPAEEYKISPDIRDLLNGNNVPPISQWRIVFFIPPGQNLTCSLPNEQDLRQIPLFYQRMK